MMPAQIKSLRILVADDNEPIRNGLCSILESRAGWVVCGQAIDGRQAVEKAVELKPDIVLVDLSMPNLNGFEAARRIHEQVPRCGILVVTEHDPCFLEHLPPQPGVSGYVVKSRIGADLLSIVQSTIDHLPLASHASKIV